DPVPHLGREAVEILEGDRDVVGCVVDEDVEAAKACRYITDEAIDRDAIRNVAGEGSSIDLVARSQLARDALGLVAALRIHDGDMCAFPRQRVADALTEAAIAARHQRYRAFEIHFC